MQVPNKEHVLTWLASAQRLRQAASAGVVPARKCAPLNPRNIFLFVGPANNLVPTVSTSLFDSRNYKSEFAFPTFSSWMYQDYCLPRFAPNLARSPWRVADYYLHGTFYRPKEKGKPCQALDPNGHSPYNSRRHRSRDSANIQAPVVNPALKHEIDGSHCTWHTTPSMQTIG